MGDGAAVYKEAFAAGVKPDPPLTVDEWADEFRVLSQKSSAEPGRYRTDRTPFLREIMRCLSPSSPVQKVVFMKSAQVGGSECGFNFIGYIIDRSPGPTMMVQPRVEDAERVVKQRIGPMLRETPVLRGKLKAAKAAKDDASDTILVKEFPGGFLLSTGANSGAGLRSMPARFIFMDEVDAYPDDVDGEGDPVKLAEKRASTFPRRKVFINSTPTDAGASNIEAAYDESDRRRYFVPCPHCDHIQHLQWTQIKWTKLGNGRPDLSSVHYECESCGEAIEEHHKTEMLRRGHWIAEHPDRPIAGFHINALYSPLGWYSWKDAVSDWYAAQGDPSKIKAFINTVLGETYQVSGEDTPEWRTVYQRRETYQMGLVPARGMLLTGACDVQKDRLEVKVVAWNRKEAWVVSHEEIRGDTSKDITDPTGPWPRLAELIAQIWPHESGGGMELSIMAIDSGFNTVKVYEFVRSQNTRRVIPIKGQEDLKQPVNSPRSVEVRRKDGKRIRRGVRVWSVGVDILKEEVYGRLKRERPTAEEVEAVGWPATYIHFPELPEEYFRQVVAEERIFVRNKKTGKGRYHWVKKHPQNEALDLMVYNFAGYHAVGAARWPEAYWRSLEVDRPWAPLAPPPAPAARKDEEPAASPLPPPAPLPLPLPLPPPPKPPPAARRKSSYW